MINFIEIKFVFFLIRYRKQRQWATFRVYCNKLQEFHVGNKRFLDGHDFEFLLDIYTFEGAPSLPILNRLYGFLKSSENLF